jgi:mannosyltransferase
MPIVNETLASTHWPARISLAAILVAGAAMRVWQARESLWLDELHTAWTTGGSWVDVAPRAAIGNQSPLFFWLEWLLVQVFGASEMTLRGPSLAAGSVLPAVLFYAGWRWTGSSIIGLTAAWLAAVDPKSIFYATEARPYALVELLAGLHMLLLVELSSRPLKRPWVWHLMWTAMGILLFYLHYTTALLLAAEAIVVVAAWLRSPKPSAEGQSIAWKWWLVDAVGLMLLCLPAIPHLAAIYERRQNWEGFIGVQPAWAIVTLLPWSWGGVVVAAALGWLRLQRQAGNSSSDGPQIAPLAAALIWLFVPVSLAWLATAADVARLFFARYLIASAPAALLLVAACLAFVRQNVGRDVLAVALCAYALWSSQVIDQFRFDGRFIGDRREDWRGATSWLNARYRQDPLPVLVRSGLIEADGLRLPNSDPLLADYCLLPVTSLYRLDVPREDLIPLPIANVGQVADGDRSALEFRGGAWLIVRGSPERLARVLDEFAQEGLAPATSSHEDSSPSRRSFGNVHIILLTSTSETRTLRR